MESQADHVSFKSYLLFFAGQQASLLGSSIGQFVVIWWITLETQSTLYLSLAMLAGFAPMVVLTPFAGVLVDRWNRKKVIGVADLLQALSTVILIMLFWLDTAFIGYVLMLMAFRSVCQAFHMPAVTAIIPLMVPRDKLSRINGLSYVLTGLMNTIGPIVAASLLIFLKVEEVLWVDPATFLVAILPLLFIRIPSVRSGRSRTSFGRDLSEGLGFIKRTRGLMPLIFLATALNFLLQPIGTLLPYYITFEHFGGAAELAIVSATTSAGMLVGGSVMTLLKEVRRKMLTIVASIFVAFIAYGLVAFTPLGWFWFMAACTFVLTFCIAPANISIRTIMQVIVPAQMLGRVGSVVMALATAASPFGMIISGVVAAYTGSANLFQACAMAGMAVLAGSWFLTDMKRLEEAHKNTLQASVDSGLS